MTEETKEEYGAWLKARIVSAKRDNHSFDSIFFPFSLIQLNVSFSSSFFFQVPSAVAASFTK